MNVPPGSTAIDGHPAQSRMTCGGGSPAANVPRKAASASSILVPPSRPEPTLPRLRRGSKGTADASRETRAFYAVYVDIDELKGEGDKMVGDDIAEEGIKDLQEINFADKARQVLIAAE